MQYYTAQEAKAAILHQDTFLCTGFPENPNRDAFKMALELSRNKPTFDAVMHGFLLGFATGKRVERARRAGKAVQA